MARTYHPDAPFVVPFKLLTPTTTKSKGVTVTTYPEPDDAPLIFGSFRTFGGTETTINDVYTVEDTAQIDLWYDPRITATSRLYACDTGKTYEVLGSPEDINARHQFMALRVRAIGG